MIKVIFIGGSKSQYYYHHYAYNSTTTITFLAIFFLLSSPLSELTSAQSDTENTFQDQGPPSAFTGITFIVFAGVIVFFMLIFYYFRESCIRRSAEISRAGIRATRGGHSQHRRGLDPAVLNTFPIYNYSDVKDLKEVMKKGELECAVCLSAFEDDETLRLLPNCDHVFHPECVDVWLEFHTTCPYCRADLVPKPDDDDHHISVLMAEYENTNNTSSGGHGDASCSCGGSVGGIKSRGDDTSVRIEEENGGGDVDGGSILHPKRRRSLQFRRFKSLGKLIRWNSTGHVADKPGKLDSERFTLRLPPELLIGLGVNQNKPEKVVVVHRRTQSCKVLPSTSAV